VSIGTEGPGADPRTATVYHLAWSRIAGETGADTIETGEPTRDQLEFAARAMRRKGCEVTSTEFINGVRAVLGKEPLPTQGEPSARRKAADAFGSEWRARIGAADSKGREVPARIIPGLVRLRRWAKDLA
jgi:hypothetical protein